MLYDALDRAILSGGVSTFEDDQYLVITFDKVPLQLDQFDLEFAKGIFICLFSEIRGICSPKPCALIFLLIDTNSTLARQSRRTAVLRYFYLHSCDFTPSYNWHKLAATATFALGFLRRVDGVHTITSTFHDRFQLIWRG